ncbi:MAG: hypothetical protein K0S39_2370 [Paenibacillus sp.]|jgi:hypothetical protein|nr:hypothetical protein [Paenibacillus sp.]
MSHAIIHTAHTVRHLAVGSIQAIPEEWFDIQPEGFNHTIRWNAGHLVTMLDWFLSRAIEFDSGLPESYTGLFISGTKPADWTVTPPAKEELIQYLSAQLRSLSEVSPDTLNAALKSPFEMGPLKFESVGQLFNFAFIHEAVHLGMISSMVKVIQAKQ